MTISGTPAPGRTITANPEGWEPNSTFSYQWSRSGQAIATTRNVRILDDDVADTIYMVTVTAQKNGFEDGVAQQSITVQTSVPSAPSGLTAVANGRAVQLAWSAPVNTGGMPLYTYRVQYRPTTGGSWKTFAHSDSPATSLTVTGLPGGTDYQFRVSSVNTVGVSIPTSPVTATTAPPDAPTTPGAPTAVAGYSRVTLTWTQPANAAAAAPFAYIVECYRDSGTAIQAPGYPLHQWVRCPSASEGASPTPNAGGQVSYAVTGLPQYYYKFRVTAVNMTGASAVSAESNRLRPNTSAPSRPRNMAGVVASDGMSITLTWNPPANLYGTPLKQYELRWYQNGRYVPLPTDDRGIVPADQPRRYVWTGYERDESSASPLGKNFYLGVFACNVDDVCSSRTRIRVRLGTPRPPTGIQTVGHDGEGYVAWTPGVISSIYGPTAYYEVEYRTGAAGYTRVTAANSNYPAITIPGLTNGKQYDVRVRAVGFNGRATAWLTTTHHTPLKPVAGTGRALGPVGDLTGQTGVERVHLTWTAPAPSADQPAAVDYLIERSNAPTGPWLVVRDGLSTETAVTVGNLRAGSQYYLRVRAINVNGLSAPSVTGPFEPTAATAPGVPTNFFGQASDNAVELSWQRPADDGGAVITAYPIQYREFGTPEWLAVPEDEEDEDESDEDDPADEEEVEAPTSFLFAGLDMDTAYEFRIAASNHAGDSEWSAPIRVTTGILSDPPTGLAAVGRYEAVGLSWTPPVYTGSQPIIGYRIEYRPQNSVQPWSVLDTLSDATMATVRNLVNGQVYDFQVRTVTYVGVSEPAMISATPGGLLVCDPPTNLTGLAGITSAALMWTAPSNAVACEVEDYIVEYRLAGDPTWTAWIEWQHEPSTETAALVEDLIHNSAYEFRVSAYNGAISDPSNVLQLTIDGSYEVPYAPEDVWSEAGYGVATLHWMAPSWDGGTPVVDYTVQVRQATAAVWDVYDDGVSADLQAVLELDPTLNFNCRVAARNVLGRGPYSDAVDCRSLVPPQAPAAPVGLTATAQDQAAALAWTAPSDNGGADITSYLVRYRSSGGSWTEQAVATATPTSVVVSGLANGTAYDFQVAAVNLAGHGAWSSTATATPDDGVVPPPVAPVNVTADVQVGCEQAVVSWSALADAVVDHYAVDYKLSSATAWTTRDAAAGQLSTTIAGLTAGAYDFRVQAVNAKGAGPWSTAVTATVVACLVAPTATPVLSAVGGDAQATLTWTLTGDADGIADYELRQRPLGETWTAPAALGSTVMTKVVTGLPNGTEYEFQVRAVNAVGEGPWSNTAAATMEAPVTAPDAPQGVAAAAGDASVMVTWTPPANDGGAPLTGYTVYYSPSGQAAWLRQSVVGATAATVVGLANGSAYDFQVSASNAVGEGPRSATATATPVDSGTAPGVPRNVAASVGDGQVVVSWQAPADDGGYPLTSYAVRYREAASPQWLSATVSPATVSRNFTGLENFTTYEFEVQAVNRIGAGPWSATVTATPGTGLGRPGAVADLTATGGDSLVALRWTAPADPGVSPVVSYLVREWTDGATATVIPTGSDATAITLSGKANGTTYYYQVAAQNSSGAGPWSAIANATPQAGLANTPAAPAALQAVAGNTQVGLSWTAPADGGSPIADYLVQYKAVGDANWRSVSVGSTATRYTVTNLVNNTAYVFRVAAVNAVGLGEWSNEANATPTASGFRAPGPPTNLQATPGDTQIGLRWSAPADNGGQPVTAYAVAYRTAPDGIWLVVELDSPTTAYTLKDLANGTVYEVKVAAINAVGQGDWSATVTDLTPEAGLGRAPGAPVVTATAGDAQVSLTWTPAPAEADAPVTGYVVEYRSTGAWISVDTGSDELFYVVEGLDNGTVYEFRVAGANRIGLGDWSEVVSAQPDASYGRLPGPPRNLTATAGDEVVALTWAAPADNGGSAVVDYVVAYKLSSATTWTSSRIGSDATRFAFTGLANGTAYDFRVAAVNRLGQGAWSASAQATPGVGQGYLPTQPRQLTATPGDGEVGLAWTPPISNGGSAVVDYVVQFKTAADAVWRSQTLGSDATFATVTGLDNGTAYTFRVAAVNGLGIGPWSAEAEATPDADQPKTPEAPTALTATPGDTVVGLTWTAPAPVAGVPVLDYAVSYKAATAATWRVTRTGADLAAYTVTGLTNGVAYDFKVAAINRVGVGQPSDTVTATPDAALARNPGVPTGLTATPGDREVGLRWTAPADNGGAPVTKYAVAYRPVEEATWSTFETDSPLTRAVVRSLANGFAYQFKVAAYNAIGVGPWSAAVEATPDETAGQSPSAPLALRAAAGNGEVGLAWLAPASDGGNPVTDYVIQYKTADEAVWSHSLELGSNATVATIKDLANGTVYAFRVAAVNAIGVGPWSNEATAAPDASLANTPGQPTAVTPTAGNTQVGLTWTAPADDGGSPVTDYVVQHRADGDATWQSALIGSTATRYTVKDLRNGVAYAFRVAAVNAIGAGDWSELARATPTASGFRAPGPPTNLTATPGDTQIGLTWTPPSDNGGTPVTQYAVAYRTSPDGVWQVVETGSPDWQHTLKGLVNGQAYDVMVAAVNRLGQGDWSTMVTSVTPAAGLGRAPLAPTAEARAGDSAVVLSWTPAPVEPGSEVTSYVVDYREAGEFWLTTATTERELVFDDLANGTVYEFRVAGVNRIGRGDWSNVVEATPQAGLGRLPGAPSGLEARPGNAQVGLSWTAPADDGGSAIQRYRIEYWTDGAAPVMVTLDSDQTRATVKGLVNDIAYSFRVAAVNGFGRGPWTATAEATPSASLPSSPSAPTALRATPGDKAVGLVWQPPQNDGGSRVVDYLVSYRACGDDCATASSTWTTVDLLSNATAYTVTGLVNGSLYEFRVAAVNAIGPGDWSTAVTAAPQAGLQAPPEAPRDLTATPGDTEVGLTWTPTGPADDYMVQYQPVGQALWQSVTLGSDATFATIRQLVNGTRYAFRVAAVNGVGVGAWSNTAEATPDGTRARTPDAPTGLTAVAGNTVVGLSWTAPANDGGAAVVDYAVSYRPSAQTGWTVVRIGSDITAYTVKGLTNGTLYNFRVAAINVVGVGVDSSVVQARPDSSLAKTPDVPTGLTAGAGDAQVGLRWTPPAFDGGSPVTKYAIAYRPVGAATWKTQMTADIEPWATVDGLFNGMRYEFKVAAYNAIGLGDWSAPAAATPKAGAGRVPDAPTGLVATPGDNEVGLKWTAPNDNGSKITAYVVAYKAKADAVWLYVNLPSDATRTTIRELANRRAFDFKVAAVNGIGTGPWSAPASATTDGSYGKTPAAPVDLAAKPGDRVVGLSWTAPVDTGGSPIESYVVFYRPVGGGLWSAMETESQVTIASVKGLTNGVEYEFKVAAVNGIGLGLDSDVVKATPDAKYGGVPTAPRDVQVTPGSTVLLVTWAPPAAAGLSGVQSYLVEYREQGSTSWIPVMTAGTQTQLRLSNLVNGQPYEVRVTAVNSVGPGEPSDVVVATPTYGPVVWTSPEALRPGETLTIHGRGFNPQEVLTVEVRSDYVPLGVHTADDGGNVSFAWTLPEDFAVGTHNAVVTDAQGTEFRAQFTVLADEIVPTGANTAWPMAAAAGGALLLGAVFLGYAWRRRQVERGIDLGRRAFV